MRAARPGAWVQSQDSEDQRWAYDGSSDLIAEAVGLVTQVLQEGEPPTCGEG